MSRRRRQAPLAGFALAAALIAGCGGGEPAAGGGEPGGEARTYQVRGILESLPAAGSGMLRIRHEAIPDLVGQSGEVEGMAAMSMPFPVADGLDLGGLAAGDPVRFELRVAWQAARPVTVTAIEKLPAGTELALE